MIKKIGIAAILGVSAIALVACGQQNSNGKEKTDSAQPSIAAKLQKASDTATQKVKEAGSATADAMSKAKKSVSDAMDKAGDKLKEAGKKVSDHADDTTAAAKTKAPTAEPTPVPAKPATN